MPSEFCISPYVFPGLNIKRDAVDMATYVAEVSRQVGLRVEDLRSPDRHRPLVNCRFSLYHVLIRREKKTYGQVAEFFHRDHSSVVHGVKQWESLLGVGDREADRLSKIANGVYSQIKTTYYGEEEDH